VDGQREVLSPATNDSILGGIVGIFESIGDSLMSISKGDSAVHAETRELYPRQPWHDVHAVVTGPIARDISSHFVQVGDRVTGLLIYVQFVQFMQFIQLSRLYVLFLFQVCHLI
jgi:hypothetical protein